MKTAEEYILHYAPHRAMTQKSVLLLEELIKQCQIDAIEETCRVCAEEATGSIYNIPGPGDLKRVSINKQSILSVADKLKKELE